MKKPLMHGIVVGFSLALLASAAWAGKAEVEKKAKKAIIGALSFKQVPVDKAIDLIAEKGGIVIKKVDIPKDATAVTFEAKFISALEALKIVTMIANLECTITDEGIEVSRKKDEAAKKQDGHVDSVTGNKAEPMITRTYLVQSALIAAAGENVTKFFVDRGAKFPAGSSIKIDPTGRKLIVIGTQANLELFENVMAGINVDSVKPSK